MSQNKKRKVVRVATDSPAAKAPAPSARRSAAPAAPVQGGIAWLPKEPLLFGRRHYLFLLIGLALLALGLLLMAGGQQAPDQWNADEIYSFRRVTLAPMLILAGLIMGLLAIFQKPVQAA